MKTWDRKECKVGSNFLISPRGVVHSLVTKFKSTPFLIGWLQNTVLYPKSVPFYSERKIVARFFISWILEKIWCAASDLLPFNTLSHHSLEQDKGYSQYISFLAKSY
jgi:hypothetical protein